jgi:hypothetical protein
MPESRPVPADSVFRINDISPLTPISSDCAAMKRIHSDPLGKSGILMA